MQSTHSKPRFPISIVIVVKEQTVDFLDLQQTLKIGQCLFCKKRTYLKSKDLMNVYTFKPSKNIRKAVEAQGDESMLLVLRIIQ